MAGCRSKRGGWVRLAGLALTVAPLCPGLAQQPVLAGSEWRPVEMEAMPVPDDAELFVQFRGEGRLAGHAGCRFLGSYQLDGDRIEILPEPESCASSVEGLEARFVSVLGAAAKLERDRTRLTLFDQEGNTLIELIQTDWD